MDSERNRMQPFTRLVSWLVHSWLASRRGLCVVGALVFLTGALPACGGIPEPECAPADATLSPETASAFPHHARLVAVLEELVEIAASSDQAVVAAVSINRHLEGLSRGDKGLGTALQAVELGMSAEQRERFEREMAPFVARAHHNLGLAIANMSAEEPAAGRVAAEAIQRWLQGGEEL